MHAYLGAMQKYKGHCFKSYFFDVKDEPTAFSQDMIER